MDVITLILTALTAGAIASVKDTTSTAIKDSYNGLKELIKTKFVGKPSAEVALMEHEKKPDVWKAPLEEGLKETGAAQDIEIITAAQKLMALVQPQQAAMGKYNVQITGNVQGYTQGDYQHTIINFGKESKETQ